MAAITAPVRDKRHLARLSQDHTHPTRHVDWVMLTTVIALLSAGLVLIYTARHQRLTISGINPYYDVQRQAISIAVGIVGVAVILLVDYRRWRDFALWFLGVAVFLLMAVRVAGRRTKGAQAWFDVGFFQFQPSEFAKVALTLALAGYCSNFRGSLSYRQLVGGLFLASIPMGLTLTQPDLGTALVMAAITSGVLLVAGAKRNHLILFTVLVLATAVALFNTSFVKGYQRERLTSFVGEQLWQQKNSQTAISAGRTTGTGFLKGALTNNSFVPEPHTDFIFTVAAEQFGFMGGAVILGLYALLAFRLFRTAQMAKDLLGTLICVGTLCFLAFHVFENVGMAMGIMPITGIPLPLLSYGGSSTIAFLALIGLCMNVHMRRLQ